LVNVDFTGSNISGAKFDGAKLEGSSIQSAVYVIPPSGVPLNGFK
jgi:uncharacterized protein YjbI with pentapeptide repeats